MLAVMVLLVGMAAAGPNTEIFRAIVVTNDAAIGGNLTTVGDMTAGGDLIITGGLEVTGGITGTNVLTTGDQTIGGTKTFSETTVLSDATVGGGYGSTGCTISAAGVLQCNGAATTDGALTAASAVIGGGYGSTGCTLSAAGVLQCNGAATIDGAMTVSGALYNVTPVLTKDANYPVTVADSGAIIKNTSVVSATFTLPAAAAGLNYCVFNYSGSDVIIEFTDDADVALNEVNSAGDSVTNTTAYDSICLTAIDAVNWITVSSIGTWADGN